MMRQCKNCVWQGEDNQTRNSLKHCPVCGDWTNEKVEQVPLEKPVLVPVKVEQSLDLNKDGKVDIDDQIKAEKDKKHASSMLSSIKSKLKRGK